MQDVPFNISHTSGREIDYLNEVLERRAFSGGNFFSERCERFFEEAYGFGKCYLTPSCTSAIHFAALVFDLKPGDEVLIPTYTFASCPNPFLISNGVSVKLVDSSPNLPHADYKQITNAVTSRTRVIMVMHYGGYGVDVDSLKSYCVDNQIYLLEDAAQCIGSKLNGRALGSFGDIAVFSFHETKNIHCGEGGLITINNSSLLKRAELIRSYGTNRTEFLNGEVERYQAVLPGLSFYQSEMNAAFLYAQLDDIEKVNAKRRELSLTYYHGLVFLQERGFIVLPTLHQIENSNNHVFYLLVQSDRRALQDYLRDIGIETRTHFNPLHKSTLFKNSGIGGRPDWNADRIDESLLRLPLHASLSPEDIDYVISRIKQFYR